MIRKIILLAAAFFFAAAGIAASPQNKPAPPEQPAPPYAVAAGTRFLISLDDRLSTKDDTHGKPFLAKTIEPLVSSDGTEIPAGARVRGHIDRIDAAGKAGRARMWLTFDTIEISGLVRPLVADLIDAPGTHSVHVAYDHEGEIETASTKRQREAQAAAAGAIAGAAAGAVAKNGRDAAVGAAIGAMTAFLVESGLGQELTLEKETKLELVLLRPLYLGRT